MSYQSTHTPDEHQEKIALAQNTPLPEDINDALNTLVRAIEDLKVIYQRETELLQTSNRQGFLDMQEEKYLSAIRYESYVRQIMLRKEELAKADAHLKKQVKDLQNEFESLAQENIKVVSRMRKCAQRLGDSLRTAAIKAVQRQRSSSYSESGAPSQNSKKPVSSGLNETA